MGAGDLSPASAEPSSCAPRHSPQNGSLQPREASTMMAILQLRRQTPRLDALPSVPLPGRTASIRFQSPGS